ncbi:PREDICTED: glutathione S-transferase T3-like [Brassica oleracea var. oleracea]|uniref:glutathione S-transferase T3-like n=1 Tax=Brassica oleracea var. oleracea TaxID=109376 RepID=UPI0006A74AC0|nr:PREDICTED: glutathione S-transferase T3-like [Brassica oleracea var. oleracea]
MDYNPYQNGSNFVDLLTSQQESVFGHSQDPFTATQRSEETFVERRERRTWTPRDDIVLISAWLNTSKDPVVGNEQRSGDFWKRVGAYFAASPKAAKRGKTSGQNDNDVLKKAHEIFYTNHKKFRLEHAFMELRHDQKWCDLSSSKTEGSSRKRKYEDGAQSSTSHATEANTSEADEASNRPPGVKAAKARGKKTTSDEIPLSKFQTMWSIKQQDLVVKERLSKMSLLDSLIGKEGPLTDSEEALKKKLITDLLSV